MRWLWFLVNDRVKLLAYRYSIATGAAGAEPTSSAKPGESPMDKASEPQADPRLHMRPNQAQNGSGGGRLKACDSDSKAEWTASAEAMPGAERRKDR